MWGKTLWHGSISRIEAFGIIFFKKIKNSDMVFRSVCIEIQVSVVFVWLGVRHTSRFWNPCRLCAVRGFDESIVSGLDVTIGAKAILIMNHPLKCHFLQNFKIIVESSPIAHSIGNFILKNFNSVLWVLYQKMFRIKVFQYKISDRMSYWWTL